ncbi:uncharacterized protein LOC124633388 [Helicoverpa zea]|uniref:uncharacterized protein LOC124633388 n=1 Tax=Helicoverpa zea TaxID=7113 RepID=UPI001F5AD4C6|nr:uncharacterized protein LOC124633388 [Helicoverpa zea]
MSCKRAAIRIEHADDARGVATTEEVQVETTTEEVQVETGDSELITAEPVHESLDLPSVVAPSEIMLENYRRAANTASHCLFPQCNNINLHNMADSFRATILSTYQYYIPVHSRVCTEHRLSNQWSNLYNSSNSIRTFTLQQVEHIFSFVNAFKPYLDFTNVEAIQEIEDNIFFFWTGRSKQDFFTLVSEVPRIQRMHKGLLGLAALLIKMRTGESDVRLSTLLDVPRSTLERLMNKSREILVQDFVPMHLGITHISRENLMNHNLTIPNGIYNENFTNAIIICDGTYININKSSNYSFQKDTYSLHKYKNLLKPFLFVACDGYILDCFGPYKATTSDADIMISLFDDENAPLRLYFQENDVFILDRGFRDSIRMLEGCNYRPYMPDSLLVGEHQLTTQQANQSRCVTICRWVVEAVNGHFKRDFKLLRQDYFNKSVPNMMQNFQIAASFLNRFGVRFQDRNEANEIVTIIRQRINFENNLALLVEQLNMNRRSTAFQSITADRDNLFLFPRLSYSELILFALGTYQIRQARSYYGEHIRFHGSYRIEVCRDTQDFSQYNLRGSGDKTLIRGKIKSRHISRKQYYVYILVENNVPGRAGIVEYCCNCLVGRRTIGCCAHVMTVVWYLGWARYEDNISAPAAFLDDVVIRELDDNDEY